METLPKRFTKLCKSKFAKKLRKEAKAVGYTIKKDDMSFEVLDPFRENDLVFKGVLMSRDIWAITFSTDYWQDANPIY